MQEILTGRFSRCSWRLWPPDRIRVVDWNIDRGTKLAGIIDYLAAQDADLLVLQEADVNTRRAGRLNIAEEIARRLSMDYVFGREFEELAEGSRLSPAYTGQATLSRWPLTNTRLIRFEQQSNFWRPRWWVPNARIFQERLGGRVALVADMRLPWSPIAIYNLHLESRGNDLLRAAQLEEVLGDTAGAPSGMPVMIAGDMNVDTSYPSLAAAIQHAGFCDVMGPHSAATTPRRKLFYHGKAIDRALVKGRITAEDIRIGSSVEASDHYPVSFTLRLS